MEQLCEFKTEIKKCCICKKYIQKLQHLVIVNNNHYDKHCLDNFWLLINGMDRYEILDKIIEDERKCNIIKRYLQI